MKYPKLKFESKTVFGRSETVFGTFKDSFTKVAYFNDLIGMWTFVHGYWPPHTYGKRVVAYAKRHNQKTIPYK